MLSIRKFNRRFCRPAGGRRLLSVIFVIVASMAALLSSFNGHYQSTALAWTNSIRLLQVPCRYFHCFQQHSSTSLSLSDCNDNDKSSSSPSPLTSTLERVQVNGVSVSQNGFHVILERRTTSAVTDTESNELYIPIKVTNDPADSLSATSPESLTLCQLLSGVDMAGPILPPELLSKLVIYHIENKIRDTENTDILSSIEQTIYQDIQTKLPENQTSYKGAHPWFQSRIRLPQVTLDQLTLIPSYNGKSKQTKKWNCRLDCAIPEFKDTMTINIESEILQPLVFQYDPSSSLMFTCIALALRYKAPIVLEQSQESNDSSNKKTHDTNKFALTLTELKKQFPQLLYVGKLQQQSIRVTKNIERGFEIHKLRGALQIAMKLGDEKAIQKILSKLDEYDSMNDLPTTSSATTSSAEIIDDGDEDDDDDGILDDLDKNILQ